MSAPEVSIVILSYNRKEYLTFNLLELTRIKRVIDIDLEIIVVDNNSYAFDVESIAKDFPSVSIIKLEENQGAVARSVGMRASEGRIIITLDRLFILISLRCIISFKTIVSKHTRLN